MRAFDKGTEQVEEGGAAAVMNTTGSIGLGWISTCGLHVPEANGP